MQQIARMPVEGEPARFFAAGTGSAGCFFSRGGVCILPAGSGAGLGCTAAPFCAQFAQNNSPSSIGAPHLMQVVIFNTSPVFLIPEQYSELCRESKPKTGHTAGFSVQELDYAFFFGPMISALRRATRGTVRMMPMVPATPRMISMAMESALKIWIMG